MNQNAGPESDGPVRCSAWLARTVMQMRRELHMAACGINTEGEQQHRDEQQPVASRFPVLAAFLSGLVLGVLAGCGLQVAGESLLTRPNLIGWRTTKESIHRAPSAVIEMQQQQNNARAAHDGQQGPARHIPKGSHD